MTLDEVRALPEAEKIARLVMLAGGDWLNEATAYWPQDRRLTLASLQCHPGESEERPGWVLARHPHFLTSHDAVRLVVDALTGSKGRFLHALCAVRGQSPIARDLFTGDGVRALLDASPAEHADACLYAAFGPKDLPPPLQVAKPKARQPVAPTPVLVPTTPPPYPKRSWVMATEIGGCPMFGVVKDIYQDSLSGNDWMMDVIVYSASGEKIGRRSDDMGGPKSFEPAVPCSRYEQIEEPDFPLKVGYGGSYRSSLHPIKSADKKG